MITSMILGASPLTMSSREIAELTGKEPSHVNRDIRAMLDALADDPELDHVREEKDARGYTAAFHLGRELTYTLLAGYSIALRRRVVARWPVKAWPAIAWREAYGIELADIFPSAEAA